MLRNILAHDLLKILKGNNSKGIKPHRPLFLSNSNASLISTFMQNMERFLKLFFIVSNGDNFHEMSISVFWEKNL